MHGLRARGAAIWIAALASSGCADLSTLTSGNCGDGVVDAHEDCDQKDSTTNKNACGQPNMPGACQFRCAFGGSLQCPDGFSCGTDSICRKQVPLTYQGGSTLAQDKANQILVADFDGDGVEDAVAVGASTVDLHYFESAPGQAASTREGYTILASGVSPAVGPLGALGLAQGAFQPPSLALPLSRGLGVFTGGTYRTLSSVPYASISLDNQLWSAVPFTWQTQNGMATDFFVYDESEIKVFIPPSDPTTFVPYAASDKRQGEGVVAAFDRKQPCTQIALAFNGSVGGHARIWSPCSSPTLVADVQLPVGSSINSKRPLHAADVDFDGNPDLVISSADNRLFVAYSDGSGDLSAAPGGPFSKAAVLTAPLTMQDDNGASLPAGGTNQVLTVGDINGDCMLDFVDSTGIYTSKGTPPSGGVCTGGSVPGQGYTLVSYEKPPASRTWTEAAIADMNADGLEDVVVGSDNFPGVTLYRGTGSVLFNAYNFPTSAPTKSFGVGDFDGDLVPDLVYAEIGAMSAHGTQDTVYISFSSRSGPPSSPQAIAQIDGVLQTVPAKEQSIYGNLIDNAVIVANTADTDVYLVPGNSARQIDAPYFLLQSNVFDEPVRAAIGSFTGRTASATDPTPVADIAVYARTLACEGSQAMGCNDLWLLPTKGNGALDAAKDLGMPGSLGGEPFASATNVLLANLGPAAKGQNDTLAVAAAGKSSAKVVLASAGTSAQVSLQTQEADVSSMELGSGGGMLAANIDGLGPKDVVLSSFTKGIGVWLWDGSSLAAGPSVGYQDLASKCGGSAGSGNLSVAAFPPDPISHRQALVALTPSGAVYLTYDGSSLKMDCLNGVPGGSAIAVGDFNGDDLPDLMLSTAEGLVVHYAVPYGAGGVDPNAGASQ